MPTPDDTRHSPRLLGDWLSWDAVDLAPSPMNTEVPLLAWLTSTLRPGLCVELGTGDGNSFRALCQVTDRFGQSGRCVGVDTWRAAATTEPTLASPFELLDEYCRTHHAESASLLRTDVNAAVAEFDDESIDLLHIARVSTGGEDEPADPGPWLRKVRPGGVVVVPSASDSAGDARTHKLWQEIASSHPAVVLNLRPSVGVAQVAPPPHASLIEVLKADVGVASTLFRVLGERTDLRHAVGSTAVSPEQLRRHLVELASRHAEEVRRLQGQHQAELETVKADLAGTAARSLRNAQEATELRAEADMLLARLATQATRHDHEVDRLLATTAELEARHRAEIERFERQVDQLQERQGAQSLTIAELEARIAAMKNQLSWRVTGPLRAVQSARLNRARRRSGS
ncbi:MAG: class I SAM-dependent methyltransferase [Acidimicrobiaceae bacterium]|nr:class I SAM-dependent methyltransferase [Acidimicrobiaceae bacterium]